MSVLLGYSSFIGLIGLRMNRKRWGAFRVGLKSRRSPFLRRPVGLIFGVAANSIASWMRLKSTGAVLTLISRVILWPEFCSWSQLQLSAGKRGRQGKCYNALNCGSSANVRKEELSRWVFGLMGNCYVFRIRKIVLKFGAGVFRTFLKGYSDGIGREI